MATETRGEDTRVVWMNNSAVKDRFPGPREAGPSQDAETLSPASLGFRAAAWLVDLLLVMLVAGVAGLASLSFAYAVIFIFIAYHTSLVWLTGKTAGKALFGLRVNRSAKKVGILWALGRASLGYFVVDLFGLGLIPAFFKPQRRCLHDLAFRSDVVFEGDHKLGAKALLSRVIGFAQLQQSALEKEKKQRVSRAAVLAALVASLTIVAAGLPHNPAPRRAMSRPHRPLRLAGRHTSTLRVTRSLGLLMIIALVVSGLPGARVATSAPAGEDGLHRRSEDGMTGSALISSPLSRNLDG